MSRPVFAFYTILAFSCLETSAGVTLMAITHPGKAAVTLQWNMVSYPGTTAYTLFKSIDGVVWEVTAANPVFRSYTQSTILAYRDNFTGEQKLYYKVKIYDINENIVDVSNTAVVDNPTNQPIVEKPARVRSELRGVIPDELPAEVGATWQLYPNPASGDLTLSYLGKKPIRGVINVTIEDMTGKTVQRFRAASTCKQLHLSVSDLPAGAYLLKLNVSAEVQFREKLIKK
jgi:Secretion system C-terminal sorting domain